MTKNKYTHIKSFNDFREEKMRLYYQIRLSEKKLEIKKLELQEYLNPIRLASALFNEISKPLFALIKTFIANIGQKKKNKKATSEQEKSPDSPSNETED